jgi:hypothetical protein
LEEAETEQEGANRQAEHYHYDIHRRQTGVNNEALVGENEIRERI